MLFKKKKAQSASNSDVEIQDEKKTRDLTGFPAKFVTVALTLLGFYHLYVGFFGMNSVMELRGTHWLVISVCVFFMYPASRRSIAKMTIFDYMWAIVAAIPATYILLNWERIAVNAGQTTDLDIFMGCVALVVVLEATRRAIGPVLTGLAVVFLIYIFFGDMIVGTMGHRGYSLQRAIAFMYTGTEGIYGSAMNVSAKYVALFVLFGAMLEKFGGGQLFVDIAYSLTGKMRGGPAKASVVASALMGSVSGSAVANVVTTGAFTIPLMKKNGYKPTVSAAVEAVASTGGQIMPPVMGAAAFLMAETTGIQYSSIMLAALIPAFYYFFAVFMMVDLEAVKENIPVADSSEIKPIGTILRKNGYLLLPLIVLITMIFMGRSAVYAASYSILAILILDLIFNGEGRKTIHIRFLQAVNKGMRSVVSVCVACACAGIICGTISLTGIGAKFANLMLSLAGDTVIIALVLTMFASLIMGCGLPTTAAYIILATLAVPALTQMGVPLLASHLFVLYFGSVSTITPPVALSAYAGAALAGANPDDVGFTALRFGIVAFIVPYMFIYSPALLMEGTALVIITSFITGAIGIIGVAIGIQGCWKAHCTMVERFAAFLGGVLLLMSGTATDIPGIILLVGVIALQQMKLKKSKAV